MQVRGKMLTFVRNRGELAEGWYDPSTNQRALESESAEGEAFEAAPRRRPSPKYDVERHETSRMHKDGNAHEEDDEDDVMGPALPGQEARERPPGPSIPNRQDLQLQREQAEEQEVEALEDLRYNRRQDRKSQREALDELVPRADPGTRERQLEKKREVNDKMRAFRDKSPVDEVRDTDLMGADDAGGLEGFKARKKEMERKKNDRELRREEILRERREEREERMRVHRAKEDETMSMLQVLAKQNFG
ncbi:MAG: hypothetical protein M4579_000595 [Chaenotheca gracillima]|nr:MAG: hypothetical protein M4579_000595 [Chaenotheca gracillima]